MYLFVSFWGLIISTFDFTKFTLVLIRHSLIRRGKPVSEWSWHPGPKSVPWRLCKEKRSRASLQSNSLKSNMENHQIDSNLHPDPAQTTRLQWIRAQESVSVQVRSRSPQQQREKLLLTAALNYRNSLEEKYLSLQLVRINIQTGQKIGNFVVVVSYYGCCRFGFVLFFFKFQAAVASY